MSSRRIYLDVATEAIGTFFVASAVIRGGGSTQVAIALGASIYMAERTSGGHFNPAVTLAKVSMEEMSRTRAAYFVAAQLAGALAALHVARMG